MNLSLLIGLILAAILIVSFLLGDSWDGDDGTPPPGMGY